MSGRKKHSKGMISNTAYSEAEDEALREAWEFVLPAESAPAFWFAVRRRMKSVRTATALQRRAFILGMKSKIIGR